MWPMRSQPWTCQSPRPLDLVVVAGDEPAVVADGAVVVLDAVCEALAAEVGGVHGVGVVGHRGTVVSRSCELEDLEGSVHDAAGLATGFGDVTSAGEMVGADREVAQTGHDAGS